MAVIINEFEASVEPGTEGPRPHAPGQPAELRPHEFRRQLRKAAMRAARVRAR